MAGLRWAVCGRGPNNHPQGLLSLAEGPESGQAATEKHVNVRWGRPLITDPMRGGPRPHCPPAWVDYYLKLDRYNGDCRGSLPL